jgi:hypothetical protein
MTAPYTLLLYSSVLDATQGFIAPLTTAAADWRRSTRANGGFWQGGFSLEDKLERLAACFTTWLGCHLVEKVGGLTTWEGMIYELELTAGGMRYIRSLDLLGNAVATVYTTVHYMAGDTITIPNVTPWATSAPSIARYGRREDRLSLGAVPAATAIALRDTILATHAWPWPRPVGSHDPTESASLTVRACGYIFTANWLFAQAADQASHNVSDWIAALIGADFGLTAGHGGAVATAGDCQFLKTGVITANTLQVTEFLPTARRTWTLLAELTALGDSTAVPWTLAARAGRVVDYKPVATAPAYYLKNGAVYDTIVAARPARPWTLKPAVVRNLDYIAAGTETGSFLTNPRDSWIEELEVDAGGAVTLKTSLFGSTDLLQSELSYLERPRPRRHSPFTLRPTRP